MVSLKRTGGEGTGNITHWTCMAFHLWFSAEHEWQAPICFPTEFFWTGQSKWKGCCSYTIHKRESRFYIDIAVTHSMWENQDFIYAFCSYLHNILYNMLCKDIIQFFLTYVTSKSYKSSWFYNMLYRKNPVSCNICYITVFGYITGYVPYKKAILHDMPFWNPDPLLWGHI